VTNLDEKHGRHGGADLAPYIGDKFEEHEVLIVEAEPSLTEEQRLA